MQACSAAQVERERQAEGAKAGGLHQAKRDAHAQLKRLMKDLQARTIARHDAEPCQGRLHHIPFEFAIPCCHRDH